MGGSVVLPASTARLRFREMTHADLHEMALLLGSADPVRPTKRRRTRADAEQWIEWNLRSYADHGHGLWVIETHEGVFVGDCGLTVQDIQGEPHIEVGYHVHLALRGQGFATEAATQVCETARAAGVEHLVAIIRPENTPSRRVALNIGLSLERHVHKNGGAALVFGAALQRLPGTSLLE
jgi:RimJ/RimL family protein N-acetyltransferase